MLPKRRCQSSGEKEQAEYPRQKRWRPLHPRESSPESINIESSGDVIEESSQSKSAPTFIEGITAKADIIPIFDPECTSIFAPQWINKIEQLGAVHNWTDEIKSYFMQSRLTGMAKVWHASLPTYDYTWEDWKRELKAAFPKNIDYVETLREMLAKRKTNESMTQYFYSKNALLTKLEIFDEKAVACIIDGLPIHMRAPARAGNYKNPSELYSKFLSVMEEMKQRLPIQNRVPGYRSDDKGEVKENRRPITCFLCQEPGHTVRRCPKNVQVSRTNCQHCGKFGHTPEKCWFKPTTTLATTVLPSSVNGRKNEAAINLLSEVSSIRSQAD